MASAVYSEPSRLSISLEGTASASPFPSPSSSFLPPPTPGAHEFAVKPVPPARNGRKSSNGNTSSHPPSPLPPQPPAALSEPESVNGDAAPSPTAVVPAPAVFSESKPPKSPSQRSSLNSGAEQVHSNGISQPPQASKESSTSSNGNGSIPLPPSSPSWISPMTPTPSSIQRQIVSKESLEPLRSPSNFDHPNSSSTTPTIPNAVLPPEEEGSKVNGTPSSSEIVATAQTTTIPSSSTSSTITSTSPPVEPEEPPLSKILIPDALVESTMSSAGLSSPMFTPNTGSSSSSRPRPISTISTLSTSSASGDPSLFSNRPAPPSPAMSRRVSGAPSVGSSSARSRSSRPSSTAVSRTNSLRKSTHSTSGGAGGGSISARSSPVINPNRQSVGSQLSQTFFAPLPSPQNLTFALNGQPSVGPLKSSSNLPSGSVPPASASTSRPVSGSFLASASSAVQSTSVSIPTTPVNLTTPTPASAFSVTNSASQRASAIVFIKIRDFGFPSADERHMGLGPEVPKANNVVRMNRRLAGRRSMSQGSVSSSDGDGDDVEEEEEDDEDDSWLFSGGARGGFGGSGGFGIGAGGYGGGGGGFATLGRFNWNSGATAADIFETERATAAAVDRATGGGGGAGFPSRTDLERNFLDGDSESGLDDEEYFDAESEEEEEEEDTLYPGLYRALYAFEPEGTAEMRLVEDQIVRVVGRGGGVGWAVVVDDSCEKSLDEGAVKVNGNAQSKHALVPESYLEPVRFDWEDEEDAADA